MATTSLKHTVKPAGQGGDYTSLSAALTGIQADHGWDLTAIDRWLDIEIGGTWSASDTAAITVSNNWVTDATRYIHIYTTADARFAAHGVAWQTGAYNLLVTDATCLLNYANYLRLDGLQIGEASPTAARYLINISTLSAGNNDIWVSNCILKHSYSASYSEVGILVGTNANLKVWNNIIYGISKSLSGRGIRHLGADLKAYSLTVVGGGRGIYNETGNTMTLKNCYVDAAVNYCITGTITLMVTCATSDSTGTTGLRTIAADTTVGAGHAGFTNVTPGSEDFHIKVGSPLIGVGTDTSGDAAPLNFTTDIDGDTRS